jgi:hypothetical protein
VRLVQRQGEGPPLMRRPSADAVAPAVVVSERSRTPHLPQNRLSGGREAPHAGHMCSSLVPQRMQKRKSSGLSCWQLAQRIRSLFLRAMVLSHRVIAYYTMVAPLAKLLRTLSPRERGQNRQGFLT